MSVQPKPILGLRVPLFDRLVDSAPEVQKELTPLRLYGRDALFASIGHDLQRLLNTRRAATGQLQPARATVLDYGIPSFTHLSASSQNDYGILADTIRQAIQIFEPRVQDVVVTFALDPGDLRQMIGAIACKVRLAGHVEPVTFPIVLHSTEGEVQVLTAETAAADLSLGSANG